MPKYKQFLGVKNTIVLGSTLQKGLPGLVHEIYFGYQFIILSAGEKI